MFICFFATVKHFGRLILAGLLGCLGLLLTSPIALADGGAPNLAYVAGGSNGISVVDVLQQGVTGSISVSGDPHMILLSLDGRFLYVTEPQLGRVAIISARTGATVCIADIPGQPTLLALDSNGNTFFAAGNGASTITALDTNNCNVKHKYTVAGHVYGLAVAYISGYSSSGSHAQLWVADDTSLTIFDSSGGQQLGNVPITGGPQYLSIPPGSSVYTTTRDGNVLAVNLVTHKITQLYAGGSFGPMDFDEITGQIYVPDQQHKQLVIFDPVNSGMPAPSEPSRIIPLDAQPQSIAITNDGQLGFAALDNGTVAMLDIPAHHVLISIQVGGTPRFVITGLYPPALGTTPQETDFLKNVLTIGAYVIIAALLIVPLVLFRRYSVAQRKRESEKMD
jgi:DNA-binding beta-propeller fold protein YncE